MILVKEKLLIFLTTLIGAIRASSWAQRLQIAVPAMAACLFSAISVALAIFVRGGPADHYIVDFFEIAGLLLLFFLPVTWISLSLGRRLAQHFSEKRSMDALVVGLYLPQAFVTIVILYSQLTGSDTIVSITGAIVTWAMFTLLLTPLTLILSFLVWSFLPTGKIKILSALQLRRTSNLKQIPVQQTEAQDTQPTASRLKRISSIR
ncbi:MAG: hypothetical protein COB93_05055 [Sneathiella sp.]|nr:MAG: hypothetical protein COB93_05055 [Sneathiella sp.]